MEVKQKHNNRNSAVKIDDRYKSSYSEDSLFSTISEYASEMGKNAVSYALKLYYSLKSDKVGVADKAFIIAALGYLIMPFDLLPDFLPGGFVDDISVMLAALKAISISPEINKLVKKKLKEYFD